jgi:WD40 repeat protein
MIKLWERRVVAPRIEEEKRRPWFLAGGGGRAELPQWNYSWVLCKATFEPNCEAVRDIQWNEYQEDVFGLVTVSGTLAVYSMHITVKALVKIAAHTGDATSLDWHPTRRFVVATGGSLD